MERMKNESNENTKTALTNLERERLQRWNVNVVPICAARRKRSAERKKKRI